MTLAIISIVINFLVALSTFTHEGFGVPLGTVMLIFWGVSVMGAIQFSNTKERKYGTMALIGFAIFIPIGAIGMIGIGNELNRIKREEFKKSL